MKRPPKSEIEAFRRSMHLGQREFADAIGCSVHSIQSIEQGRMALSERMSDRIFSLYQKRISFIPTDQFYPQEGSCRTPLTDSQPCTWVNHPSLASYEAVPKSFAESLEIEIQTLRNQLSKIAMLAISK